MRRVGEPLYVAVDVGTSGARAVAVTISGRVVAQARRSYRMSRPRPGWVEQNAAHWVMASEEALGRLLSRVPKESIGALGLTGQCPSVVAVDKACRPLAPAILYLDNRAILEAEEFRARIGDEMTHERTGHVPAPFYAGPKLLWMRRHQQDEFRAARYFLQPRDFVLQWLTGKALTDQTHAGTTLLFDLRHRQWSEELIGAFGLDVRQLPDVVAPWTVVGRLRRKVVERFALPAGLPVVIGGADSLCAAYGVGIFEPGPLSEMSGSSSCFNSATWQPVADLKVANYVSVVPGIYFTELGLNVAGAAIAWAVAALGFGSFARLNAAAQDFRNRLRRRRGPSDPVELAPMFLPYLGDGDRDDPRIRGALLGLSGRHDASAIGYSVLEGIALAAGGVLTALTDAHQPFQELRVSGGGSRLPVSGQIKADALGVPVLNVAGDSTAIGTALLAAEATGETTGARSAIGELVAHAQTFEPDPRIAAIEQVRARGSMTSAVRPLSEPRLLEARAAHRGQSPAQQLTEDWWTAFRRGTMVL